VPWRWSGAAQQFAEAGLELEFRAILGLPRRLSAMQLRWHVQYLKTSRSKHLLDRNRLTEPSNSFDPKRQPTARAATVLNVEAVAALNLEIIQAIKGWLRSGTADCQGENYAKKCTEAK
jgi:hypothetical protein